jgi:hypothetical protein
MVAIIIAAVIGAFFGFLGIRVLAVFLLSLLLVVSFAGTCVIGHADPLISGMEICGSVVALQLTFAAVVLCTRQPRPIRDLPHIQAAIGNQLRAELEVSYSLPPELLTLVARLPSR